MAIQYTRDGLKLFRAYQLPTLLENSRLLCDALCGLNEKKDANPELFFQNRERSVAEHCDGVKNLILLMTIFYSQIVSPDQLNDYMLWALIHDLGENRYNSQPEKATLKDAKNKVDKQRKIRFYLNTCLPAELAVKGRKILLESTRRNTLFGQTVSMIDATETILRSLFHEKEGRCGSVYYGYDSSIISDADKQQIQFVGTTRPADNWLFTYLCDGALKFDGILTFIEIIQSATFDVRGHTMQWLDQLFH